MNGVPPPPEGIRVHGVIPEHISLEFSSTGLQGGDAGHGGNATLEINWEGGSYIVNNEEIWNGGQIILTALGDWEIDGMVRAFITMGDLLKHVFEKMERK
jgi:hypothetical protein